MIEKLRRKFILITMGSVILVLTSIMVALNIFIHIKVNNNIDKIIDVIIENKGIFPDFKELNDEVSNFSIETSYRTRYFTVVVDSNNNIVDINTGKIAAISSEDGKELAIEVIEGNKTTGYVGIYKYRIVEENEESLIVFIDSSNELETLQVFYMYSIIISIIGTISVILLVVIFSKKVVQPVAQSLEKQKQFITDAGHELKTPLAIINANTEVIEMENGDSEWTTSIRNQVNRLSDLTMSLVSLARMEEKSNSVMVTDFSLSDAIDESSKPFYSLAKSQGKKITTDIESNITYKGDEKSIRQLISILLDNAIKYSTDNSEIEITLKKRGRQSIISVSNKTKDIKKGNLDILFDRFYRTDSSRNSKTGGFGIGLSIAKSIVDVHKGNITAKSVDGKSIIIGITL
ncbi:sensor histidine kinase [Clostridium grantii]|uniref:histidine kinase n=1 Tax=Clostridium grantii DSM 8605 TaxID=1121316 RepID=A0A1M5Y1J6_9CLOT|nr:HAMP domain-containing sensor histidine kinase [Clostridium grantii]SHI05819.1 His Kinase A (phospho-acceptor) domain-containing protein [Clostridium grantii DSM 8605]